MLKYIDEVNKENNNKLTKPQLRNQFIKNIYAVFPETFNEYIKNYDMFFYRNETNICFVTSDMPYNFMGNDNNVFIYFPLSKDIVAIFEPKKINSLLKNKIIPITNISQIEYLNNIFIESMKNNNYCEKIIYYP